MKSFVELTKYFTEGVFTKIVKKQEKTHEILLGESDEEKDIKEGINQLAEENKDVFSFSSIKSSLLYFCEGTGQGFRIISKAKKDSEKYKLLCKVNKIYR